MEQGYSSYENQYVETKWDALVKRTKELYGEHVEYIGPRPDSDGNPADLLHDTEQDVYFEVHWRDSPLRQDGLEPIVEDKRG